MRHILQGVPMKTLARERATMVFAKLGVWDTEANNGVLIYVLLKARLLEIVADRGITHKVSSDQWKTVIEHLSAAFGKRQIEQGLSQAIGDVGSMLEQHFPLAPGQTKSNELSDTPIVL
jgi:uncharacterized membrane protein